MQRRAPRLPLILLLICAAAPPCARAEEGAGADHVVDIRGLEAFEAAVAKSSFLVGEFFAPWCGHCKSLEPEYKKAAAELKAAGSEVVLAKIDATLDENKDLAAKYEIRGFPTLKIFRNGNLDAPSDYNGPREAAGIVSHLGKLTGPASKELSTAEEVTEFAKKEIAVLGVFPGNDSKELAAFEAAADQLREDLEFAHTLDAKLASQVKASPGVVVMKTYDEPLTAFKGAFTQDALLAFIEEATTPQLVEMEQTPRNKRALAKIFSDSKTPKVLGLVPKAHKLAAKLRQDMTQASKEHKGDLSLLYVDTETAPQVAKFFAVEEGDLPAYAIHEQGSNTKYVAPKVTAGFLAGWLSKYQAGKLEKFVKSEPEPKDNSGPVKVVTAKSFDKLVFSGKNVLIEFYAPWCGHCKQLEPVYVKVGEHFAKDDSVVIAKLDATANDVPSEKFAVQGFPTLYWVGADGSVSLYEGGRSVEDLTSYVEGRLRGEAISPADGEGAEEEEGHEEL